MTNRSSVKVSGFDTAKRQVKRYRRAGLCAVGPIATAIAAVLPGCGGAWAASVTTITATSAQDYATAITDANNTGNTVTVINQYGASISLGGASLPALTNGGLQIGDGNNNSPIAGGTITNNTTLTFVPTQGCCSSADKDTTNIAGGGAVTVKFIKYNYTWYEGFTLAGTNTYTRRHLDRRAIGNRGPVHRLRARRRDARQHGRAAGLRHAGGEWQHRADLQRRAGDRLRA